MTKTSHFKIPPRRTAAFVNPDPERFEVCSQSGLRFLLICRETFLPAYKDEAEHKAASAKYFPGFTATQSWRCVHCGLWHFTGKFTVGSNGETLSECDKSLLTKPSNWPRVRQLLEKKKGNQQRRLF